MINRFLLCLRVRRSPLGRRAEGLARGSRAYSSGNIRRVKVPKASARAERPPRSRSPRSPKRSLSLRRKKNPFQALASPATTSGALAASSEGRATSSESFITMAEKSLP